MNRLTKKEEGAEFYHYPECYECSKSFNYVPDCSSCDFIDVKVCERLGAYEDTGLTPEQINSLKDQTFNKINLQSAAFAEVEEQLNNELTEAIRILKRSPMFEGRVTIAIVISNEGNTVRPILYKTKYMPRKQNPEMPAILPGQSFLFDEE